MSKPGYSIGLAFAPTPAAMPGYAQGLEFVRGDGPFPEFFPLTPCGAFPALSIPEFAGMLEADVSEAQQLIPSGGFPALDAPLTGTLLGRFFDRWQLAPSGSFALDLDFSGQLAGFYAEHHTAELNGVFPMWMGAAGGMPGLMTAAYDSRVDRTGGLYAAESWQAAQPMRSAWMSQFDQAAPARSELHDMAQTCAPLSASLLAQAQITQRLAQYTVSAAQQSQPLRAHAQSIYQVARPRRHGVSDSAQQSHLLRGQLDSDWQVTYRRRGQLLAVYEVAGIQRSFGMRKPIDKPLNPGYAIALEFAPELQQPRTWQELQLGDWVSSAGLAMRLRDGMAIGRYERAQRPHPASVRVPWPPEGGGGTGPIDPNLPAQTIIIPLRRAYIVHNNIVLTRLDSGTQLPAIGFEMSLDYTTWTWSWSASLHHSAAAHLEREANGEPAQLEVSINGVVFRLRLERRRVDYRFNPSRWAVSGRGLAAVLSEPWAPQLGFGNPNAPATAQQLAQEALTMNGVGIGWDMDWQLSDWLVPAGAWSLQGRYIDAVNDVAGAAGGYVQPHNTDRVLRILPKYPVAPWHWGDVTPDFELPARVAEVVGVEDVDKPDYNRVFVGGISTGVFGPITRAGTAGDLIAPQVTHALMTDHAAQMQRGLAELSDTGRQEHVSITMQVLPETGVILPGRFVRHIGPRKTVMGIVRGTSIRWDFPKLRQTLEVETHG